MSTPIVTGHEGRRVRLKRVELDLLDRLERRFGPPGGVRHTSDPLYQRLWFGLARVRRDLAQIEQELAPR
jgi:hypothetical protein